MLRLIALLLSFVVTTQPAIQSSPYLKLSNHMIVAMQNGRPCDAFMWESEPDNDDCYSPEASIFVHNGEATFTGSWMTRATGEVRILNLTQKKDGSVILKTEINDEGHEDNFANYEQCMWERPEIRKVLEEYFFDPMQADDPLDDILLERITDPQWQAPSGVAENVNKALPLLDNDLWKVRDKASYDLFQTGIDGAIYSIRNVKTKGMSLEKRVRLENFENHWFLSVYVSSQQ